MKSSCHSLIPFLLFFLITFDCHLQNSAQFSTTHSNDLLCPFIALRNGLRRKHSISIVEVCLLIRCLAMDVLLRAYASTAMCLPSRCLAMGLYVTILSVIIIFLHHTDSKPVYRRLFDGCLKQLINGSSIVKY
jgi:hypothetical protein